jgi:peroxiredoxin
MQMDSELPRFPGGPWPARAPAVPRWLNLRSALAITVLATFTVWITWRAKTIETAGRLSQAPSPLIGKPAPDFSLESLDGRTVSLADYRGKTVAVTFWASWCGPCRLELPVLTKLYQQTHRSWSSFEILALSVDDTRGAAQDAARSLNLPFPVLLDLKGRASASYKVEAIPMLFVVNKAGNVAFSHTGFQPGVDVMLAQQFGITNYTPVPGAAQRVALSAPVQVSPPDGATFDVSPRTTKLVWGAVPGALNYAVEIDCLYCCSRTQWCSDIGALDVRRNIPQTEYTFDFVGAQPGRWRVWAIDATGQEGPKSPWWGFTHKK